MWPYEHWLHLIPVRSSHSVHSEFVFKRRRKVKAETRIRRREDGTRGHSRCCTVYRFEHTLHILINEICQGIFRLTIKLFSIHKYLWLFPLTFHRESLLRQEQNQSACLICAEATTRNKQLLSSTAFSCWRNSRQWSSGRTSPTVTSSPPLAPDFTLYRPFLWSTLADVIVFNSFVCI